MERAEAEGERVREEEEVKRRVLQKKHAVSYLLKVKSERHFLIFRGKMWKLLAKLILYSCSAS